MVASAIKLNVGATLVWRPTTGDYTLNSSSLAAVTGRIGAVGDLGAWPRSPWLRWYSETAWLSAPVANETLDFHVAGWDNDTGPASPWAQVASTDSALTATQRQNMKYIGSVVAESAGTGIFSSGGWFFWPFRYLTPILYNASAAKALAGFGTQNTIIRITSFHNEAQ